MGFDAQYESGRGGLLWWAGTQGYNYTEEYGILVERNQVNETHEKNVAQWKRVSPDMAKE